MQHHPTAPARRRLTVPAAPTGPAHEPLPLFLRAPYVALLWALALFAVLAGAALGRVRLPRAASGVAVAVRPAGDSLALLLLLPPSAVAYLHPGQVAALDTGGPQGAGSFLVAVTAVERTPLDAPTARRRFRDSAGVLAHLDGPRAAAWLERCAGGRCLTPAPGASYAAVANLGTRSLAGYAMPRS